MSNPYNVDEEYSVRSEILNLTFTVKSFQDKKSSPVLVIKDASHVITRLILSKEDFYQLKEVFQRKDRPEWNFFSMVESSVNKSLLESKLRRIQVN